MQKLTPRDQSAKHTRLAALAAYFRSKCEVCIWLPPAMPDIPSSNVVQRPYVVEQFTVPVEHVGRVFGRGGLVLREIQDQSRAKIEIPRVCTSPCDLPRSPRSKACHQSMVGCFTSLVVARP